MMSMTLMCFRTFYFVAGVYSGPEYGFSNSVLFLDMQTPCIGKNRIDFHFLKHENRYFMEGGVAGR